MHNPFLSTPTQNAGHGTVHVALLPPSTSVLQTMTYQYPLKLISPAPSVVNLPRTSADSEQQCLVHTLYILTYGGGIVAGDNIFLSVTLDPDTRLILLTQGSTKIFKSPTPTLLSRQNTTITVHGGAAVCYLPDPVQPFEKSCFKQEQIYDILPSQNGREGRGNLCVLDWVSCGRAARGEDWHFWTYASKNEVYLVSGNESEVETGDTMPKRRLLLRDNLILDGRTDLEQTGSIADRMDGLGVFGTLILYGPMFERLARFFMDEFKALPRIGGRKWDSGSGDEEAPSDQEVSRATRQRQENADGLMWSAATVRGCVVVKFGAKEVEGGRKWIRSMLESEGTVVDDFGERALMCLR